MNHLANGRCLFCHLGNIYLHKKGCRSFAPKKSPHSRKKGTVFGPMYGQLITELPVRHRDRFYVQRSTFDKSALSLRTVVAVVEQLQWVTTGNTWKLS